MRGFFSERIIQLAKYISDHKQAGKDTTEYEIEVDKLVYQLYSLTEEEIRIVERS